MFWPVRICMKATDMNTRIYTLGLIIFSFFFVCAKWTVEEEYLSYQGIATDLKSNQFYYLEEHKETMDHHVLKQTTIQYKDSAGTVIARKIVDYSGNKVTPAFEQNDYRDGYTEGVSYSGNKLVFKFRKNNKETLKTLYKDSQQNDEIVFKMEPDNYMLRKLVDPIRVTYKVSTKRIIKYEGLSNINDKKGKSYLVKIMYPKVGP
ncbi:MAG: hypothetical protein K0R51_1354 [Cytophagaceae bacterium]|nr:hypothetical protein [Cytophagaceae bacterium]